MQAAVTACDLHHSFGTGKGRQPILRGVDLTVAAGETVYLVGRSGSGKTTLLSILGCILTPDAGSVWVLGRQVARMSPVERTAFRRDHVSFIFQSFNLFPTLSALDNLLLAQVMRGTPRKVAAARAADLLGRVSLAHRAGARPAQLSTGECQRLAIARALAADADVILADEPTASLDAEHGWAVMDLLSSLVRERGVTLIVVTHDNRIFPFADRILELEDGRLMREQTPDACAPGRTLITELAA